MPIIIPGNGPINGTLPAAASLTTLLTGYPGLIGAFDDDGLPATGGAAVTAWNAKIGPGQLTQASTRAPTQAAIDGKSTAAFDGTKSLKAPITGTSAAPLTFGWRFWHAGVTTDFQRCGLWSSAYYLVYRTTGAGEWRLNGATGLIATPAAKVPAWHTLIATFDGSTARYDLNGVVSEVAWTPPASVTTLGIGHHTVDTNMSQGLIGNIRRVFLAQGNAYGTDAYQAVKTWLGRA